MAYRSKSERESDQIKDLAYNAGYAEGAGRLRRAQWLWDRVLERIIQEHDRMRRENYVSSIREDRVSHLRAGAEAARRYGRLIGEEQEGTPERRASEREFRARLRESSRRFRD